ncbi:phosphotriesterase [Rhodocytophaga rosea]|uniref:Phosphotriesterase n=1 Tax=Rhodocytophaga rosea TaxID=2704465 RepID=A0A6C0GWB0_9BACT|nr:phosphotriesterase [Rhodocytophaga rosea]QHT71580.1 phosphotriesterase [Rhodocytophaga rosea]
MFLPDKQNLLSRRTFISSSLLMASTAFPSGKWPGIWQEQPARTIMTVNGEIAASKMGFTLSHEHVIVDFGGADKASPDRYNRQEVFNTVLPYLKQARKLGCRTFIDCTPAYLARDPQLLRQLSEASGLHIITNTGYYGARNDESLPPHAFTETADQLSERWRKEAIEGIEGTGIKPGFMKIGVDGGKLSDIDRKLVQAAARTHLQTGLTIAVHTGNGEGALEEMAILKEEGVAPEAWIWVHAQSEADSAIHAKVAGQGGWVSFDGIGWDDSGRHVELVSFMKKQGLLEKVLVSHDAGWYHVGETGGGKFQSFEKIFTTFLPELKKRGFSRKEINQLLVKNPMEAFTIRIRKN